MILKWAVSNSLSAVKGLKFWAPTGAGRKQQINAKIKADHTDNVDLMMKLYHI
jgi:hypothetical protein